eukprot:3948729-Ditylum_brightwellii.AAC.1
MTKEAFTNVAWWKEYLSTGPCAISCLPDPLVITTTQGDGSSTGTGGIFPLVSSQEPAHADKEWWMGVWMQHTAASLSNWKEFRSLVETLEQEIKFNKGKRVKGRYLIYFMDNLVTYHVVQRGSPLASSLHALVKQTKLLAVQLEIMLEVIHIPSNLVIRHRDDSLSYGLWPSP